MSMQLCFTVNKSEWFRREKNNLSPIHLFLCKIRSNAPGCKYSKPINNQIESAFKWKFSPLSTPIERKRFRFRHFFTQIHLITENYRTANCSSTSGLHLKCSRQQYECISGKMAMRKKMLIFVQSMLTPWH